MSPLQAIRQQQNLTQEELCEKSCISVRTIQRIEAGTTPKGYTLKTLAKALGVREDQLLEKDVVISRDDAKWLKWINIAALPFMFLPPLNIAAPLLIMFAGKQFATVAKKIVTIQIVWSLIAIVLLIAVMVLNDMFLIRGNYMKLVPVVWLLVDAFVILRNAAALAKHNTLYIDLNFTLF